MNGVFCLIGIGRSNGSFPKDTFFFAHTCGPAACGETRMRPEAATWFERTLGRPAEAQVTAVLNVESSSGYVRKSTQPLIDSQIIAPLTSRIANTVHCDMEKVEGKSE